MKRKSMQNIGIKKPPRNEVVFDLFKIIISFLKQDHPVTKMEKTNLQ